MLRYDTYPCWMSASKSFGRLLLKLDPSHEIVLWPTASELFGNRHLEWSRDLIKFFDHLGAIEIADDKHQITENTYYVNQLVIEEIGLS